MKQLCMMNDTVKHPKATPRTLYVVVSAASACRRSVKNQHGVLRRGWNAHIRQIRPD